MNTRFPLFFNGLYSPLLSAFILMTKLVLNLVTESPFKLAAVAFAKLASVFVSSSFSDVRLFQAHLVLSLLLQGSRPFPQGPQASLGGWWGKGV